jgi:lipopolysaccharide/colanic/teichoic acid biosynthesis glycosyltransferase
LTLKRRFCVKPGITGLWQVSGRSDLSFERWMRLDLEYIDRWSVALDLRILCRTIPAVLTARGAA